MSAPTTKGAPMFIVIPAAIAVAFFAFLGYAVVRDGARRNAYQDAVVAEWLARQDERRAP